MRDGKPLTSVAVLTDHTRPVESLDARPVSDTSAVLYTADTMGIIKIWDISKDNGTPPRWRSTLVGELQHHRTKVDDMIYGNGLLWTGGPLSCSSSLHLDLTFLHPAASTDETVHIIPHVAPAQPPAPGTKPIPPIQHPTAVRTILPLSVTPLGEPYLLTGSGDVIRVYDVSSPEEPELIAEIDAHWHDVTALRLWIRKSQVEGEPGKVRVEPWIVSASLDGTLRRWKLDGELDDGSVHAHRCDIDRADLLHPPPPKKAVEEEAKPASPPPSSTDTLDEDEERELAELMGED